MLKKRHERHAARAAWAQPLYFAFDGQPNDAPLATGTGSRGGEWAGKRRHLAEAGVYVVGSVVEYQAETARSSWTPSTWNDTVKAGVQQFALASMDATQDSFFWTWKIGAALNGVVQSPLWSYSLGLENGFMPTHPRDSSASVPRSTSTTTPSTAPSSRGRPAAPVQRDHRADAAADLHAHRGVPSLTFITPTPSITAAAIAGASASASRADAAAASTTASVGSGWFGAQDTLSVMTPVAGCTYPDAWSALSSTVPPPCTGTTVAR
ncbi:hypothetical protein K438DRAFT_1989660 [Mycena galopus ATCC 62051]|nr:hypothetical protein K438DRAFT_1989660 [Mycena galopus ATCC 62051]